MKIADKRFATQHSQAFIGRLICSKDKECFVAVFNGSIVEKYNIGNGKLIATYYGPDELFFPEYNIVPAGSYYTVTPDKKERVGYVDIDYCEKKNKIYLLYSGNSIFGKDGKINVDAAISGIIYVMDDKEKLTKKFLLDKEVYNISVSENGTIYGATENEILKFERTK